MKCIHCKTEFSKLDINIMELIDVLDNEPWMLEMPEIRPLALQLLNILEGAK
jgi:hypothetical protein